MVSINEDRIKRIEARSYDFLKEPLTHRIPIYIPDDKSIISFEKTIEPLIDLLPNIEEFVRIAKEKCKNPSKDLAQDESASIMLYSCYRLINCFDI